MSCAITHTLARRVALTSRLVTVPTILSRAFVASAQQYAEKAPSLSDVSPSGAALFDAKQQEFRTKLAEAKQQADSQFSSSASTLNFSSSTSTPASASQVTLGRDDWNVQGLGSLSTSNTGEEREKLEAQHHGSTGGGKAKGALSSLIYGTQAGREMDREIERSFSQMLARGKYVHSIVFHEVKPDKVDKYVELVGGWYPKVAANPENKVHLVGSWRTEVGDCDTFVHIWEYQRYHGYHESLHTIQSHPEFAEFDHKLKSLIRSKRTSLMQEFSFWPTSPPRQLGGIFELRAYNLHPGNLLEWETHWRKGLQARREVMEGVGAWFVQVGELNTVYHLWQFANLEERRARREKSWSIEGWGDTVHKTVPLIQTMTSRILIPMKWSAIG